MKTKRFLSVILAAVMMIGLLAACGNSSTSPSGSSEPSTSEPSTSSNSSTAAWEPNRPINIVVPYSAGGAIDQVMRALQPHLSENLGVAVTVTNQPEGATVVAYENVVSADADGYTIMAISPEIGLNAPLGVSEIIPDTFSMIGFGAAFANTVVVHKDSPYQTIADLVNDPNLSKMTRGTAANGDPWTQSFMVICEQAGVSDLPTFIPQGGGFSAAQAVMRKEIDFASCGLAEVLDLIVGGDIRVLGYFGKEPYEIDGYGTVPPYSEVIPSTADYAPYGGWCGLGVRAETDQAIVDRLIEAYNYAYETEEFQSFLAENCFIGNQLSGKDAQADVELRAYTAANIIWKAGLAKFSPEEVGIKDPKA